MVDKPKTDEKNLIATYAQSVLVGAIHFQIKALRLMNREAAVVILGKAEYAVLDPYMRPNEQCSGWTLFGLEVKIDGDVGVRVG